MNEGRGILQLLMYISLIYLSFVSFLPFPLYFFVYFLTSVPLFPPLHCSSHGSVWDLFSSCYFSVVPISTGAATQTQGIRSFCCVERHSQLLLEGIPPQGSLDIPTGYRAGRELLREVRTNPLKAFPAPIVSDCLHSGIVKDWSCGYKFIFCFLLCMKESQKSGSEWGREGEISRRREFSWYQECPAA